MLGTIIVGVILVIIVALIVRSMVHDKKNGKSFTCCLLYTSPSPRDA